MKKILYYFRIGVVLFITIFCYSFYAFSQENRPADSGDKSLTFAGGEILGKFIDNKTKEPVKNFTVIITEIKTRKEYTASADETGKFMFTGLPDGEYKIGFKGFLTSYYLIKDFFKYQAEYKKIDREQMFSNPDILGNFINDLKKSNFYFEPGMKETLTISPSSPSHFVERSLHHLPVINLEIVDEQNNPVPYMQLTVFGYKPKVPNEKIDLLTDENGKQKIIISSSLCNTPIIICSPAPIHLEYKITLPAGFAPENIDTIVSGNPDQHLPEHPNTCFLIPEIDKESCVKLIIRKNGDMLYTVSVIDKDTSQPVQKYKGVVVDDDKGVKFDFTMNFLMKYEPWMFDQDLSHHMVFKCDDQSGKYIVSRFQKIALSKNIIVKGGISETSKNRQLGLRISSPGYKTSIFYPDGGKFYNSGTDVFEIEKE